MGDVLPFVRRTKRPALEAVRWRVVGGEDVVDHAWGDDGLTPSDRVQLAREASALVLSFPLDTCPRDSAV